MGRHLPYFCPKVPAEMASRSKLLAVVLLVAWVAAVFWAAPAFVGGQPAPVRGLRATASRQALPAEAMDLAALDASSVQTALQTSVPGLLACIVAFVFPCAFLMVLYMQSEKTKRELEADFKAGKEIPSPPL